MEHLAIAECEPEDAIFLMEGILHRMRAGQPVPYFLNLSGEARDWARFASPYELRAYALAAMASMSPGERSAVLRRADVRGAA